MGMGATIFWAVIISAVIIYPIFWAIKKVIPANGMRNNIGRFTANRQPASRRFALLVVRAVDTDILTTDLIRIVAAPLYGWRSRNVSTESIGGTGSSAPLPCLEYTS